MTLHPMDFAEFQRECCQKGSNGDSRSLPQRCVQACAGRRGGAHQPSMAVGSVEACQGEQEVHFMARWAWCVERGSHFDYELRMMNEIEVRVKHEW